MNQKKNLLFKFLLRYVTLRKVLYAILVYQWRKWRSVGTDAGFALVLKPLQFCTYCRIVIYESNSFRDSTVLHQITKIWSCEFLIFIIISFSLHLSLKKRDYKIYEVYFSRFYAYINTSHSISNLPFL